LPKSCAWLGSFSLTNFHQINHLTNEIISIFRKHIKGVGSPITTHEPAEIQEAPSSNEVVYYTPEPWTLVQQPRSILSRSCAASPQSSEHFQMAGRCPQGRYTPIIFAKTICYCCDEIHLAVVPKNCLEKELGGLWRHISGTLSWVHDPFP